MVQESRMDLDLDLSFLTIEERQTILSVLKRDEQLRQAEQVRKRTLKNEITQLRQQSAIRVGTQQKARQCIRCHEELGLIFNKGEICVKCKHKICPNCRVTCSESSAFSWLCSLCYKQRLLPAVAGDWFYEKLEEKYKHEMQPAYGSEAVRSSIRRLTAPYAKGNSAKDSASRSNPFTEPDTSEKSAGELANGTEATTHTVRKITSRRSSTGSSSEDSDDADSKHSAQTASLSAVQEVDETDHRLSPDGCSPSSSKDDIKVMSTNSASTKPPVGSLPTVSVTDEEETVLQGVVGPAGVSTPSRTKSGGATTPGSAVFEEEDIDDIFREAKRDTLSPRIASHLSVSTDSLHSSFTEADYNKHEIAGEIKFNADYEKSTGVLTVTVSGCRGLTAAIKKKNTSDPYVKCYLVSGNQRVSKRKTKVIKASLNPQFDETFRYTLSETQLLFRTLQLSVWSAHRIGTADFLGEVNMPLDSFIFEKGVTEFEWYPLGQRVARIPESPRMTYPTELRVSLHCSPPQPAKKGTKAKKAEVQLKVHSAKNLPFKKHGTRDSFIKCVLLPDKTKFKTAIIKDKISPVWDETFTFSKKEMSDFEECALELTIWDHDRLGYHDLLGAVRFSLGKGTSYKKKVEWMDAGGKQKEFWERMLNNPLTWVENNFIIRKHVPTVQSPEIEEVVKRLESIEQQ